MSSLAARITQLREKLDLTQEELCAKSGVSRETIAKIECGTTLHPTRKNVEKLAVALGVSASYLLFGVQSLDSLSQDVIDAANALQSLPEEKRKALIDTIKMVTGS
jgi:transcriptional regulator with XRE-family HTH domain